MSEYQYIEFRAVDRTLTDSEYKFADKQSTRAHITRRSFQNEYHYGDFNGDVNGLLRRGYDVFMHYANFGIRKAAFRLPAGLPFPKTLRSKYIDTEAMKWSQDRKGKAGILSLSPCTESGDLEQIWEPGEYINDFAEVRRCLVAGDLRALYVLWLCAATDEDVSLQITEPPVPGGLSQCEQVFGPFLEFFGIDPLILLAASEERVGSFFF